MGSLLRLASSNWSSLRRHNSTPPGSLITHSAVSASNCTTTSFPRLTAPTYILPWYNPILPQRSTRLGRNPVRQVGQHCIPAPMLPLPRRVVESARMGQAWVRLHAGPERAVGIRLALHLVLLVQPTLQLRRVVAAVRLCPILGQPLAPLHHAVVLRPPRRVPDHPDVQADQPQGKGRREIATRPPGIAVVHPQRYRSPPLPETAAQLGLHHSGGHLGEVALGGKHDCAALPPSIHQPPEARKSSGHRPGVSGRRHRPPSVVRMLGPLPTPTLRPTGWGWSQVVPAQPALDGPHGGEFGLQVHPHQFDSDAAGAPAGMLTAQLEGGFQHRRSCEWARPTGVIAGL